MHRLIRGTYTAVADLFFCPLNNFLRQGHRFDTGRFCRCPHWSATEEGDFVSVSVILDRSTVICLLIAVHALPRASAKWRTFTSMNFGRSLKSNFFAGYESR
jgi:hypothetical protein